MENFEIAQFAGSAGTLQKHAYAALGVPNKHRSQWHATASDGSEVVSIWTSHLDRDGAEPTAFAHVHKTHLGKFAVGQTLRAVILDPFNADHSPNEKGARVRDAFADHRHVWTVVAVNAQECCVDLAAETIT